MRIIRRGSPCTKFNLKRKFPVIDVDDGGFAVARNAFQQYQTPSRRWQHVLTGWREKGRSDRDAD